MNNRSRTFARLIVTCLLAFGVASDALAQALTAEVVSRREALASEHSDGLIIIAANWEEKKMEQPGWIQDASFHYFTLLRGIPGVILVIDAPASRTILFSPPAPESFGVPIEALNLQNRLDLIALSGADAVMPRDRFMDYVESRLGAGVENIYLDEPRRWPPSGVPEGMLAVTNSHRLWRQSLEQAFPTAQFRSAAESITKMRWTKSAAEVEILTRNAGYSAAALRSGMQAVRAGLTQRQAEGAVVAGCLNAGAEGPSFWPWVMTGPNGHLKELVRSFYDYENLNRVYRDGELVRVDIGCQSAGYGGDVGRTVPVSGSFSREQAVIWDLLITGYLAGLDAMRAGATLESVRMASRAAIQNQQNADPELAARMASDSGVNWHIHGIGIESGETPGEDVFRAGAVVAYEPMFVYGADAFYLEDMILITEDGMGVLTTELPYSASEIASFLASDK